MKEESIKKREGRDKPRKRREKKKIHITKNVL
jgi:uncharacterized protein YggL (DUF469 family)